MACNNCKKKKYNSIISEHEDYVDSLSTKVNIALIVWGALGLYGFFSLILDIFSLI